MSTITEKPLTRMTVEKKRIADVAEIAKRAFAEHRVELLFFGTPPNYSGPDSSQYLGWRCAKPATGIYAFNLLSVPGRLIVYGDVGSLILERQWDMLQWARSSIRDVSYFAEKALREFTTHEFDPEMVRAWAAELDADILAGEHEYDSRTAKLWLTGTRQEVLDAIDDGEQAVNTVIHESGLEDGCDLPDFTNWTHSYLWCRECIKWFLDNHHNKPTE